MPEANAYPTAKPITVRPLVIGIVAGEVSGDALGADLMRQMNNIRDDIIWVGVGGSQMQGQGLTSVIDMSRLAVMGLVEVLKHLPDLFRAKDEILAEFDKHNIDMFIGIDAPDFNLRLGERLKAQGVYCVQYVSPSIWAWREGRIEKIKRATHLVLCLFPFELPVYRKHHHPAICVGHSLLHTLDPNLTQTPIQELRRELIWDNDELRQFFTKHTDQEMSHLIAVMPGSRRGEISAILPMMLESIRKMLIIDNKLFFIIPTVNRNHHGIVSAYLETQSDSVRHHTVVCCDESQANFSQQVMACSDLILLASGTATLEAMLLGRPMVVVYVMKNLTYQLAKRLVKVPYVALPNILAGREIVPELIQQEASAENISRIVSQTLTQKNYHKQLRDLRQTTAWLREQSNVNPAFAVIDGWLEWQKGS
ncbi:MULTISPECIES: lipid-A-disaccharide synthase [unclassified Moraxella]|uniref:lipid-A-disaccharide synthase n=1 Tax=unclassified Moraxella TaxID=2685852 RepID=UPI003AF6A1A2